MDKSKHFYLEFPVKALNVASMWQTERLSLFRQWYLPVAVIISASAVIWDFFAQIYENDFTFTSLNQSLIGSSAELGVLYIMFCFTQKNKEIKSLVEDLSVFECFSSPSTIDKIEKNSKFYTKFFIIYGIVGNIIYGFMPFLNYTECQENRPMHMVRNGIPCGLIAKVKLPFKYDYTPLKEIVTTAEISISALLTTIIMMVTMLICGILMHITAHLKELKFLVTNLPADRSVIEERVRFCVKFHTVIIDYATRADKCFNQMMLLHISWTGFIVGILGFNIIVVNDNFLDNTRFVMHLWGWLLMLFLICYYGQTLMDESFAISNAAYSSIWYKHSANIRKYVLMILLRSQKPLTLTAVGLKVMSLAAFLGVLYSAYSYFTLLLKLKPS